MVQAILDVKDKLGLCRLCNNISDSDVCQYCRDANRDGKVVCVVEEPHNIVGIESRREFGGRYHVLHGPYRRCAASPDSLKIKGLVERMGKARFRK